MDFKILEKIIDDNKPEVNFETDGIGMTWGVSYIRLTIGEKTKFENIEHFLYSTLKSAKNMTSMIEGGQTWEQRADLKEWARNLQIEEILPNNLSVFIQNAIVEINDNLKYWEKENSIDISKLMLIKEIEKCYKIKKTVFSRHYINTTEIYLFYNAYNYYYIEEHLES